MNPTLLALLRDPQDRTPLHSEGAGLVSAGGRRYPVADGIAELVADRSLPARGRVQRWLMEQPLVARLYEGAWRPVVFTLCEGHRIDFASEWTLVSALAGEALHDVPGPVLDLSCGPGLYARALAARFPGRAVLGVDLARPMLRQAQARAHDAGLGGRVLFVRGDAARLPLADASVAAVVNIAALHIYPDTAAVLAEVRRVLVPRGVYVASVVDPGGVTPMRPLWAAGGLLLQLRTHREPALRTLLAQAGFVDYQRVRLDPVVLFRARVPG